MQHKQYKIAPLLSQNIRLFPWNLLQYIKQQNKPIYNFTIKDNYTSIMANILLAENISPVIILSGTGKQISHPNSCTIGLIGEKNIPSAAKANKTSQNFPVNATAIHPTLTTNEIYV